MSSWFDKLTTNGGCWSYGVSPVTVDSGAGAGMTWSIQKTLSTRQTAHLYKIVGFATGSSEVAFQLLVNTKTVFRILGLKSGLTLSKKQPNNSRIVDLYWIQNIGPGGYCWYGVCHFLG